MCNLYESPLDLDAIKKMFGIDQPSEEQAVPNTPQDTLPGYPGLAIHEVDGARVMATMVWGFRLRLKTMSPTA